MNGYKANRLSSLIGARADHWAEAKLPEIVV
jgi:hypothetical protein